MNRLGYRNFGAHQTLVGNLTTDVNGADLAGVRWFELRKTGSAWGLDISKAPIPPTSPTAGWAPSPWTAQATSRSGITSTAASIPACATPAGWPAMRWA